MEDTKYKFEQVTGCTAFNFYINEEPVSDIPPEKQEEILDYILIKIKEGIRQNSISFESIIELFQYDDYECDDYKCEQCGDNICTTTWNI
jgi:hypothetical protein